MQLEQLEHHWQSLNQKLDQTLTLQTEMLRHTVLQPARRRVNRLVIWPAIDIVFCLGLLFLGGIYVHDHWQETLQLFPAVTVMLGALALLLGTIWQLQRISELDWAGPVVTLQCTLDQLRVARIRQFKWIMLLAPLMGFCGFTVGIHWLLEWQSEGRVQLQFHAAWVLANYIFGILFVPIGYFAARWLARRCDQHPWWQNVLDGISGTSLHSARQDVARWANLQNE